MKSVLVTGASGYIGSHVCKELYNAGYNVTGLDLFKTSNDITPYVNKFIQADLLQAPKHNTIYDVIVHLADYSSIQKATEKPAWYLRNNISSTLNLLHYYTFSNIVFGSSLRAFETDNEYSETKIACEEAIRKCNNYTILRIANVAGSSEKLGRLNVPKDYINYNSTIVTATAQAACGKRSEIIINGTDWNTKDGTCVRDFVHIDDVVSSIIRAVESPQKTQYECIASGECFSVRDVIAKMKSVTSKNFSVVDGPRREGDIAVVALPSGVLPSTLFVKTKTLDDMCLSEYNFQKNASSDYSIPQPVWLTPKPIG